MSSWSTINPASVGVGVAKTNLGTNAKPSVSQNLIEFVPFYCNIGAVTAGESILLETAIESTSVAEILPKRIINPPIQAGLGATFATLTPILESWECNTPLTNGSNEVITAFGQAQIANTVAPAMGVALHYDDFAPAKPQVFWDKPDNETNTGLVATTVNGGSMTINGGQLLKYIYGIISAGVVTASESYLGSMQFNSVNFGNSQDLEVPVQPNSVGLGALNSALNPKLARFKEVNMVMETNCTIDTVLRLANALTVTGNFIGGVGYLK